MFTHQLEVVSYQIIVSRWNEDELVGSHALTSSNEDQIECHRE